MGFQDLDELLVARPIKLPIRGKSYAFPGQGDISAQSWLRLQKLERQARLLAVGADLGEVLVTDQEEAALMDELLGPAKDEMLADGCTQRHMQAVLMTLMAYHLSGREAAEAAWKRQGEAPAPGRGDSPTKSPRPRGSRAGSTPPKAKAASPGSASSATGS
jgi:hypothetical protein